MVSTCVQPDHTSRTGAQYKTNLESTLAVRHRIAGPY